MCSGAKKQRKRLVSFCCLLGFDVHCVTKIASCLLTIVQEVVHL